MPGTALVTGASSGIGREIAWLAAKDRHDVVLVGRRKERLELFAGELASRFGVAADVVIADISEPGSAARIFAAAEKRAPIEVLVNAAGLGVHGFFWKTPIDQERDTILVNVLGLTELTKLCVTGMVERRRGRVLNVASTAAFQPGPLMAVYYATKAYVLSFTEALAEELRGTGVTATALCPGPVLTGFQEKAGMADVPLLRGPIVLDVAKVARAGWRGAMRGKRVVVPGIANRVLAAGARFSPRRLSAKIARRLQENRKPRGRLLN
jgi:short-subunit dehydrogenase